MAELVQRQQVVQKLISAFMTDVADDPTPQLGGDLDGQGNYSLDNQSITNLASNGAGYVFDGVDDAITTTYDLDGIYKHSAFCFCKRSIWNWYWS